MAIALGSVLDAVDLDRRGGADAKPHLGAAADTHDVQIDLAAVAEVEPHLIFVAHA
jgi:hypothetical protein